MYIARELISLYCVYRINVWEIIYQILFAYPLPVLINITKNKNLVKQAFCFRFLVTQKKKYVKI